VRQFVASINDRGAGPVDPHREVPAFVHVEPVRNVAARFPGTEIGRKRFVGIELRVVCYDRGRNRVSEKNVAKENKSDNALVLPIFLSFRNRG